jgi:HEAT repeat protein
MKRLAAVGCALLVAASLPAHGGQYRGAGIPVPPTPGGLRPGVPTTGGPPTPIPAPTPGAGAPNTGGPVAPAETSWQIWWELNKDEFVQRRREGANGPATGSDDFYLGARRAEPVVDALLPTAADLTDRVVPALAALLNKERNRDVQTACLLALAKIGRDGPGVDLERELLARLPRGDQEVRETAALALGIAGRASSLPKLLALLADDAEGRRLCERDSVDARTRAFAAYGLGILARSLPDAAARQRAHDALMAILRDGSLRHRDLRVAAVSALGLIGDARQAGHKRLAWLTVEELLAFVELDLGAGDEMVQAQALLAIGRLLGRGSSSLHQRCKERCAAVLAGRDKRGAAMQQSAAIALGMLAVPSAGHAEDAAFEKALQTFFERGVDRLARNLAAIALGRIGGAANRSWLLTTYQRANKTTERPWLALALGLIAAQAAADGTPDAALAGVLLDDLSTTARQDVQGALAIAVGLTRYAPAASAMLRLLREHELQEELAGYLCVGIGLLGDRTAAPALLVVLERSPRRPLLLLQAAVGLGCLGDREASDRLVAKMRGAESTAVRAALASAVGRIGDRRGIEPLLGLLADDELSKLARAFVAAALGGIGDRRPLPWNEPLSRDSNWSGAVDTLTNGATGVLDLL